jgi:hypothetical protein
MGKTASTQPVIQEEIPIQEKALEQLGRSFKLETIGWGNQATIYRIAERVGEDARRATGRVLKVMRAPEHRDEEYNLIPTSREEQLTSLQGIAREIARQRALLIEHLAIGPQDSFGELPELIPEIGDPIISTDKEGNPVLCLEQEDMDPEQTPFEETYEYGQGREQPDASLRSLYNLGLKELLTEKRNLFFELTVFANRVKALTPKLGEHEDLMLHPKNVCISHEGHLCLPDILTIEESGDPDKLTSSMGIAFVEEGLLKRPINLQDPYYRGVANYMQKRGCETVSDAHEKYYQRFL